MSASDAPSFFEEGLEDLVFHAEVELLNASDSSLKSQEVSL
jgi:hypothetical protein